MWEFPILKSKSRRGNEVIKVRRISVEPEKYKDCLVVVGGGGRSKKKPWTPLKCKETRHQSPKTREHKSRSRGVNKSLLLAVM